MRRKQVMGPLESRHLMAVVSAALVETQTDVVHAGEPLTTIPSRLRRIQVPEAWRRAVIRSRPIVAVIDTGSSTTQPLRISTSATTIRLTHTGRGS